MSTNERVRERIYILKTLLTNAGSMKLSPYANQTQKIFARTYEQTYNTIAGIGLRHYIMGGKFKPKGQSDLTAS